MKTFGKIEFRVDKMAGLITGGATICPWDDLDAYSRSSLDGVAYDEGRNQLWKGRVLTNDQIQSMITPFENDGHPTTIAMRPGRLGKPKLKGLVRLASHDGQNFEIQLCNSGEETQSTLVVLPKKDIIILELQVSNGNRVKGVLLDISKAEHQNRLRRL